MIVKDASFKHDIDIRHKINSSVCYCNINYNNNKKHKPLFDSLRQSKQLSAYNNRLKKCASTYYIDGVSLKEYLYTNRIYKYIINNNTLIYKIDGAIITKRLYLSNKIKHNNKSLTF